MSNSLRTILSIALVVLLAGCSNMVRLNLESGLVNPTQELSQSPTAAGPSTLDSFKQKIADMDYEGIVTLYRSETQTDSSITHMSPFDAALDGEINRLANKIQGGSEYPNTLISVFNTLLKTEYRSEDIKNYIVAIGQTERYKKLISDAMQLYEQQKYPECINLLKEINEDASDYYGQAASIIASAEDKLLPRGNNMGNINIWSCGVAYINDTLYFLSIKNNNLYLNCGSKRYFILKGTDAVYIRGSLNIVDSYAYFIVNKALYKVKIDGTSKEILANDVDWMVYVKGKHIYYKKENYLGSTIGTASPLLIRMDVDGGEREQLISGYMANFYIATQRIYVAMQDPNDYSKRTINVMDIGKSTNLQPLSGVGGDYVSFIVSEQDSLIYFIYSQELGSKLCTCSLDGQNITELCEIEGLNAYLFGEDDAYLYAQICIPADDNTFSIIRVNKDSGEYTVLKKNVDAQAFIPETNTVYYLKGDQLYACDSDGNNERKIS